MSPSLFLMLMTAAVLTPIHAQERRDAGNAVYRVEFNIHDGTDAAAKAGRRYSMLITNNDKGTFRAGQKVPYATSTTQFNYADVGVNIEARIQEQGGAIKLSADLELSTIAASERSVNPSTPTIAALRVAINAMLAPAKPTTVASIDDPITKRRFDVEATVTRVD